MREPGGDTRYIWQSRNATIIITYTQQHTTSSSSLCRSGSQSRHPSQLVFLAYVYIVFAIKRSHLIIVHIINVKGSINKNRED